MAGSRVVVLVWSKAKSTAVQSEPRWVDYWVVMLEHWMQIDGKIACAFSSAGGWGGGMELACQSVLTVLINFGFLVFGVTDYVAAMHTPHYGAVTAREPRTDEAKAACRLLGKRLAEWTATYVHGRRDQHPGAKLSERTPPS